MKMAEMMMEDLNFMQEVSLQPPCFICFATISATSMTCIAPPSVFDASLNIVIQKGQPTAKVFAPVDFASAKRVAFTRAEPGSSSFHICAPPAPQQKDLAELRGISITSIPADARFSRGASKTLLCRPK